MKYLFLIPARGGSKGIPGKNIKDLAGKSLIQYSLDLARKFVGDEDICISTDDEKIISCLQELSYEAPFKRPESLATDTAGTYEVLLHALEFYESQGKSYDALVLLQPTSPLRKQKHLQEMLELYDKSFDMLVSVCKPEHNPICVSFTENEEGNLQRLFADNSTLRQAVPDVFNYNGAIYIMNVESLKKGSYNDFNVIKKYEMDPISSLDLDTPDDWDYMEYIIQKKNLL